MKIYTIAEEVSQCYGHGDYGTEQRIIRMGGYGMGDFPPCFRSWDDAHAYLKNVRSDRGVVVELTLVE